MISEEEITSLYKKLHKELFAYLYKLTRSQDIAEDILHDSFVNLIQYSKKHNVQMDSVRAFLYKTAFNLSVNFFKKNTKINFLNIDDSKLESSNEDMHSKVEYDQLNEEIFKLLHELDDLSRTIFIMKKELNLKLSEIAANTGKSERTIRRKLQGALEYISSHLKEKGFFLLIFSFMSIFEEIFVSLFRDS